MIVRDNVSSYRMLVVCANWEITIGRFDSNFYMSTTSRCNYAPIKGNLSAIIRIFGRIKYPIKI